MSVFLAKEGIMKEELQKISTVNARSVLNAAYYVQKYNASIRTICSIYYRFMFWDTWMEKCGGNWRNHATFRQADVIMDSLSSRCNLPLRDDDSWFLLKKRTWVYIFKYPSYLSIQCLEHNHKGLQKGKLLPWDHISLYLKLNWAIISVQFWACWAIEVDNPWINIIFNNGVRMTMVYGQMSSHNQHS